MPYIPKDDRTRVASSGATNPGELNFELTLTVRAYLRAHAPLKYAQINDVVSALDWCKHAFRIKAYGTALQMDLHRICGNYVTRVAMHSPDGYATNNAEADALGALECCKLEFYRRVAVPYEDGKIKTNGDVY